MKLERPEPKRHIPDDAKKVFSGVIFDVYQWEQEMFDGTTATFEMLRRPDTVVIIPVTSQGTILLVEEEQPGRPQMLTLPGGRVEKDEDIFAAAQRELREETGASAPEWVLWHAEQPAGSHMDYALFVFIARGAVCTNPLSPDSGERIELKEVSFLDFVAKACDPSFETVIAPRFLRTCMEKDGEARLRKEILGD